MGIVSFTLQLAYITIGLVIIGTSAYGLGLHQDNTESNEYKISIALFSIGIVLSVSGILFWHQGNFISAACNRSLHAIKKAQ
jgi:hypothetical protein